MIFIILLMSAKINGKDLDVQDSQYSLYQMVLY